METLIIKETLKSKLNTGVEPAVDFLYNNYSSMLYGYVLQFIPDKKEAEKVLVLVFGALASRLQEACNSTLSVYCWMQVEARKVILEYKKKQSGPSNGHPPANGQPKNAYYLSLLQEASEEQRLVFSEIFLQGREKEELANQLQKNVQDISRLLKESLLIMQKNLQ
ncbi:hypothetical protein D3H65_29660 [Paraflavitalea soli]|uniref:Sigma-70 family RNA polymerase sigma factor n=1 Tax=Paraflavitalea soli TaxID=2315862 RepID=A0A3B7MTN0_9BACT|nr:hypothetical protein [Paraflavitalea soli]AXY77904.1 hypothetical protein D3H65_29660 [Paraflavitalea soli]